MFENRYSVRARVLTLPENAQTAHVQMCIRDRFSAPTIEITIHQVAIRAPSAAVVVAGMHAKPEDAISVVVGGNHPFTGKMCIRDSPVPWRESSPVD